MDSPVPGAGSGVMDVSGGTLGGDLPHEPREGCLLVRVHVPELNVHKCLQFPADQLVWDVKQQCLAALPKELKESFNYGLFCPPANGKAGKFLDEERRLGDYPFNGPVGYLELKYKRRVYKMLKLDERQLKALHTRANLRRFLDYVTNGQVEKVAKMCSKGLDPNFHCQETGETPLTMATATKRPARVLIALVNGGALLDYRTREGSTALHRAVERDCLEAVNTLLELGASPNYKDGRGLTPVYLSITHKSDPQLCAGLLHDHASLGAQDLQGWQEVHQACRNGLVQHLENLLFYGADMDARNASGNTPLHVCAVNAQEACARMLLFRGAERTALNFSNQTPYQVAVIAGNLELAEIIRSYRAEDVVPFRGPPRYNPRRRSGLGWNTIRGLNLDYNDQDPGITSLMSPLSPTPSNNTQNIDFNIYRNSNIDQFDNNTLSRNNMVNNRTHMEHYNNSNTNSIGGNLVRMTSLDHNRARIGFVTRNSSPSPSDLLIHHHRPFSSASSSLSDNGSHGSSSNRSQEDDASIVTDKSLGDTSDIISNSSGVGTSSDSTGVGCTTAPPGSTVVCLEPYPGGPPGHMRLDHGDLIEVTGSTDCGLLEGAIRGGRSGLFPSHCVQEVRLRQGVTAASVVASTDARPHTHYSATAPRVKKTASCEPRSVVLHRAKRGFGFVLRGAKASSPLMALRPSERFPALQYLDDVDPGGVADLAGLRPGDFLLEINGEDVTAASHEHVVELIRGSGALVSMTVVSQNSMPTSGHNNQSCPPLPRQYATLPRKMSGGCGTLGRSPAPMPPRRDPKTTLSVGRARAKSMVAGLEGGGEKDDCEELPPTTKSSSAESIHHHTGTTGNGANGSPGTPVQPRTASIRARPTSSRITAAELEELFQRQQGSAAAGNRGSTMMSSSRFQSATESALSPPGSPAKPRVYASVAEMKRKGKSSIRARAVGVPRVGELHRDFHSTPDLAQMSSPGNWSTWAGRGHRSQEDVHSQSIGVPRPPLPPPTHPPPPPPIGQVVKVDVSRGGPSEYEAAVAAKNVEAGPIDSEGVMSSFRPASNAKLYASPQDVRAVGYRARSEPNSRSQVRKTQSMRNSPSSFKPTHTNMPPTPTNGIPPSGVIGNAQTTSPPPSAQTSNPYAQPIRSNSNASRKSTIRQNNQSKEAMLPPPIPDPDYSMSESDGEGESQPHIGRLVSCNHEEEVLSDDDIPRNVTAINTTVTETSGNSNTSGSSTGSGSMAHSFSVDEIQKIRTQLKCSKSYPNDFLGQHRALGHEEGDNSSSGVSSDQEVPCDGVKGKSNDAPAKIKTNEGKDTFNDNSPVSPPCKPFQRHNSLTRKQAATIALNRAKNQGQSAAERLGVNLDQNSTKIRSQFTNSFQARHAVSLAQLPPPIEADCDENAELFVPPPPEFEGGVSPGSGTTNAEAVLAPPPEFSDKLGPKVRIVGAVPKQSGRLHSQ